DLRADEREVAAAKILDPHVCGRRSGQKCSGACARLCLTLALGAEHDPVDADISPPREQLQDRSAAPDLDVVAVRAEKEHARDRSSERIDADLQHPPPTTSSDGSANTSRAPHSPVYASCATISSLRFHGSTRMRSGRASAIRSGAKIGMCVPGRNIPCLCGLRSTVYSSRSARIPQ